MTAARTVPDLAAALAARADEADVTGRLPAADIEDLRAAGYFSLSVPREFGGQGLSLRDCAAAQLTLAGGSTATALVAAMQLHLFGHEAEVRTWPEANWARLCRLAVEGALFNSAASEPRLGSPSRGAFYQTMTRLDGESFCVNGHKNWVTGGAHLTHILVKTSLETGTGIVMVPQATPGVRWESTWRDSLSLRASQSDDLYLDDVRVPADHLIFRDEGPPEPNIWFPILVAATYLGAALASRTAVIQHALERVPTALGRPIATLPKIQRQIGEMDVALQAAELLLLTVAGEWTGAAADRAAFMPRLAAAKHLATEASMQATETALRIAGGLSMGRQLPLERYFRDARAALMHPPAGDSALELAGRGAIWRHAPDWEA